MQGVTFHIQDCQDVSSVDEKGKPQGQYDTSSRSRQLALHRIACRFVVVSAFSLFLRYHFLRVSSRLAVIWMYARSLFRVATCKPVSDRNMKEHSAESQLSALDTIQTVSLRNCGIQLPERPPSFRQGFASRYPRDSRLPAYQCQQPRTWLGLRTKSEHVQSLSIKALSLIHI